MPVPRIPVFNSEWKNVDYQPETAEEERMGREYFQFFNELNRLWTITSAEFRRPRDWAKFLEESPDPELKSRR